MSTISPVREQASPPDPVDTVELEDGRTVTLRHIDRSNPTELIIAAHDAQDDAVGMAICDFERPGVTAGATVMVVPSWQGVGLGHALLDNLVDQAALLDIRRLVGAYPSSNHAATQMLKQLHAIVARRVSAGMVKVVVEVPFAPASSDASRV